MESYEKYVREQLTSEQNKRLNHIVSNLGPLYLDSGAFTWMIKDFSNIDERIKIETDFLVSRLKLNKNSSVFDACLGSGATSIGLKSYGIDNVISNELDKDFIDFAEKEASSRNIDLTIRQNDWRGLKKSLYMFSNWFDAVVCTGNSLTYLMRYRDQQEVVSTFSALLKKRGKLVIDTRNYTELLRGNFRNTGSGPYKGTDKILLNPLYVATDMILLRYTHKKTGLKGDLLLYPFKDGEIECLMMAAGLKDIKIFGDYKENFDSKTVDFYTIIGTKD